MRKVVLTVAASAALVCAVGLGADRANAITLTSPNGVRDAAQNTNLAQDVRWVCRYNRWGHRHCWWQPGYYRWGYR